jgi:type IV pilus assembly protein PilN
MARINLLPWRAERRKQRQQEFVTLLALSGFAAVVISALIWLYHDGQITGQEERNEYLRQQITEVQKQIDEIALLDKKKADLLARKEVIEKLQASRSQMVHLFDELVRTIPEGVRLNSIKQNGDQLTLEGSAQSNARVSSYMRNLEASGWMANPDLTIIEAKGEDRGLPNMFSLTVRLKDPSANQTDEVEAAAAAPAAAGGVQ